MTQQNRWMLQFKMDLSGKSVKGKEEIVTSNIIPNTQKNSDSSQSLTKRLKRDINYLKYQNQLLRRKLFLTKQNCTLKQATLITTVLSWYGDLDDNNGDLLGYGRGQQVFELKEFDGSATQNAKEMEDTSQVVKYDAQLSQDKESQEKHTTSLENLRAVISGSSVVNDLRRNVTALGDILSGLENATLLDKTNETMSNVPFTRPKYFADNRSADSLQENQEYIHERSKSTLGNRETLVEEKLQTDGSTHNRRKIHPSLYKTNMLEDQSENNASAQYVDIPIKTNNGKSLSLESKGDEESILAGNVSIVDEDRDVSFLSSTDRYRMSDDHPIDTVQNLQPAEMIRKQPTLETMSENETILAGNVPILENYNKRHVSLLSSTAKDDRLPIDQQRDLRSSVTRKRTAPTGGVKNDETIVDGSYSIFENERNYDKNRVPPLPTSTANEGELAKDQNLQSTQIRKKVVDSTFKNYEDIEETILAGNVSIVDDERDVSFLSSTDRYRMSDDHPIDTVQNLQSAEMTRKQPTLEAISDNDTILAGNVPILENYNKRDVSLLSSTAKDDRLPIVQHWDLRSSAPEADGVKDDETIVAGCYPIFENEGNYDKRYDPLFLTSTAKDGELGIAKDHNLQSTQFRMKVMDSTFMNDEDRNLLGLSPTCTDKDGELSVVEQNIKQLPVIRTQQQHHQQEPTAMNSNDVNAQSTDISPLTSNGSIDQSVKNQIYNLAYGIRTQNVFVGKGVESKYDGKNEGRIPSSTGKEICNTNTSRNDAKCYSIKRDTENLLKTYATRDTILDSSRRMQVRNSDRKELPFKERKEQEKVLRNGVIRKSPQPVEDPETHSKDYKDVGLQVGVLRSTDDIIPDTDFSSSLKKSGISYSPDVRKKKDNFDIMSRIEADEKISLQIRQGLSDDFNRLTTSLQKLETILDKFGEKESQYNDNRLIYHTHQHAIKRFRIWRGLRSQKEGLEGSVSEELLASSEEMVAAEKFGRKLPEHNKQQELRLHHDQSGNDESNNKTFEKRKSTLISKSVKYDSGHVKNDGVMSADKFPALAMLTSSDGIESVSNRRCSSLPSSYASTHIFPDETIFGEIAFQIERRVLAYIFRDHAKSLLYGYNLRNIILMIRTQQGEKKMTLQRRYDQVMEELRGYGWKSDHHPQFVFAMIDTYGTYQSVGKARTIALERGWNDPLVLRQYVLSIIPRVHLSNMIVLLDCLTYLATRDEKPILLW